MAIPGCSRATASSAGRQSYVALERVSRESKAFCCHTSSSLRLSVDSTAALSAVNCIPFLLNCSACATHYSLLATTTYSSRTTMQTCIWLPTLHTRKRGLHVTLQVTVTCITATRPPTRTRTHRACTQKQMMIRTALDYPKYCCLLQCLELSHVLLQAALTSLSLSQRLMSAPEDLLLI